MPDPWDEILADPAFQAEPPEVKMQVAEGYFREHISPDPDFQAEAPEVQDRVLDGFLDTIREPEMAPEALIPSVPEVGGPAVSTIAPERVEQFEPLSGEERKLGEGELSAKDPSGTIPELVDQMIGVGPAVGQAEGLGNLMTGVASFLYGLPEQVKDATIQQIMKGEIDWAQVREASKELPFEGGEQLVYQPQTKFGKHFAESAGELIETAFEGATDLVTIDRLPGEDEPEYQNRRNRNRFLIDLLAVLSPAKFAKSGLKSTVKRAGKPFKATDAIEVKRQLFKQKLEANPDLRADLIKNPDATNLPSQVLTQRDYSLLVDVARELESKRVSELAEGLVESIAKGKPSRLREPEGFREPGAVEPALAEGPFGVGIALETAKLAERPREVVKPVAEVEAPLAQRLSEAVEKPRQPEVLERIGVKGEEAQVRQIVNDSVKAPLEAAKALEKRDPVEAARVREKALEDAGKLKEADGAITERMVNEVIEAAKVEPIKAPEPTVAKKPQVKTVVSWVQQQGGINFKREQLKGELDTLSEGIKGIVNKQGKGLTLDELALRAKEEGFITEATPQAMLDALGSKQKRVEVVEAEAVRGLEREAKRRGEAPILKAEKAKAPRKQPEQPDFIGAKEGLEGKVPAAEAPIEKGGLFDVEGRKKAEAQADAALKQRGIDFVEGEKPRVKVKGVSAAADIGEYKKAVKPLSLEMPEVVELAKELSGGKHPKVVKKIARIPDANGIFRTRDGSIELRADLFKDPEIAKRVLSHEIGHLADWLPDKTMKRGNLVGRIASLNKNIKGMVGHLETSNRVLRKELIKLTQEWKPFDVKADKKYTAYRHSSKELYADAVSVLLNDPALLQKIAPEFNAAFSAMLHRKPKVKEAYDAIIERQAGGEKAVIEHRQELLEDMFERGERKQKELEEPRPSEIAQLLKTEVIDRNTALIQRKKQVLKRGGVVEAAKDPEYWTEELPYIAGEVFSYQRDVLRTVFEPLKEAGLKKKDLRNFVFLRRVATERAEIANPLGFTKETATKQLNKMKADLGAEKYAQLEEAANNFWRTRQKNVFPTLEKAQVFSPETMKLIKDNDNYVTFDVQAYMNKQYGEGVSSLIYEQLGTLADITDPIAATMMKDSALIRMARTKMIKEQVIDFHNTHFPVEVQEAKMQFTGKARIPKKPTDPNMGTIAYLHEGKVKAFYVDKYIADVFMRDPFEAGMVVRFLETITQPLKEIFVGHNPIWTTWNIQRDVKAFAKQLPGGSIPKAIYWGAKSGKEAWLDVVKKESSPLVEDMYKRGQISPESIWRGKEAAPDAKVDRMLRDISRDPRMHETFLKQTVGRLWDSLAVPGKVSERIGKIAGRKFLETKGLAPKEIDHLVRTAAGSPDFLRGGQHRRFYNSIFLFSNAAKEGIRAAKEAALRDPMSYWYKTVKYDLAPKLAMAVLASGFFGQKYKQMMDAIPDHDKTNYITPPLWLTKEGKVVYAVIPHDFQGQILGGLFWQMLKGDKKLKDIPHVLDYMSGATPYSGLNPWIGTAIDVEQYVTGRNPYNEYYGSPVIPELAFDAGGSESGEYMLRHIWNQMGGGVILRLDNSGVKSNAKGFEKLYDVPIAQGALKRFIRVSNRGIGEELRGAKKKVRKVRAKEILGARSVMEKIFNGEQVTKEEAAKVFNVSPESRQLFTLKMLAKRHGDVFMSAYLTARSKEEKRAVIKRYDELRPRKLRRPNR